MGTRAKSEERDGDFIGRINTRALKGSVSGQTVSLDEAAGTEANVGTPSYNGLRLDLSGADDRKQRW